MPAYTMAVQINYPENSPIVRNWNKTLNKYEPDHRGDKYVYWYVSGPGDDADPGPEGLNILGPKDWHYTAPYDAPTALPATNINPAVNFKARWSFPTGITQAKLFVFLDAEGKTLHPDFAGILVDNITELVIPVAIAGQYVAYTLISFKDGKPVSLNGNQRVVALDSLEDKAEAMGLTYLELNDQTFTGTVTKNQAGLYSDSAQQAAAVAGAGHFRIPITGFSGTGGAYRFDTAGDNKAIEIFMTYKLSSVAGGQRIFALSSTTSGVNCTLQYASSDGSAPIDDMRFFFRDNAAGNKWDVTIPDTRTTATRAVFMQVTKVGGNWVGKLYDRVTGGSAAQRGTTQSVAVSGQVLINILSVFSWERTGVTNYMSGKGQPFAYGIDKTPSTEAQILDLLNTLTLAA